MIQFEPVLLSLEMNIPFDAKLNEYGIYEPDYYDQYLIDNLKTAKALEMLEFSGIADYPPELDENITVPKYMVDLYVLKHPDHSMQELLFDLITESKEQPELMHVSVQSICQVGNLHYMNVAYSSFLEVLHYEGGNFDE